MKRSELQEIIRAAINEIVNEDLAADLAAKEAEKTAIDKKISALQKKKSELSKGGSSISETEIDEMANVSVKYQLAPDVNAADFARKKGRIITTMQASDEPMSKTEVAIAMGYDKQNPINGDFMELVANGIIVPAGQQAAPRLNRPQPTPSATPTEPGEEDEEEIGDEEEVSGEEEMDGIINRDLSDEEVDAMFAQTMRGDEEEPEVEDDIETGDVDGATMSDEDYDAFMKYTDLEDRLNKVKSDILKTKRFKSGPGDIRSTFSAEVQNLRALKDRLQQRMDDLVANSPYLQARKAKTAAKNNPEPSSGELDEWTKKNWQYYAGIIK